MDNQFMDALENGKMRRFGYCLHNRVNNKLVDQEDTRLQDRLEEKRIIWERNFKSVTKHTNKEDDFWENVWYELSCILYTKSPPTYEEFLRYPQIRDEEAVWKSLSCFAHGYTLNETANPVHYDELITTLLTLYWPEIMHDSTFRLGIDAIMSGKITYLKKVWLLRREIFNCTKEIHKAVLKELFVSKTKHGDRWAETISIDDIRALHLQHKKDCQQTFESLEAEMKSYEAKCNNNTCRPTATIEI